MQALLFGVLAWAMSGAVARFLTGAGLTVVVFAGVGTVVQGLLSDAAAGLSGLPGDVVALLYLSGIGVVFSILGSALLSRVALVFAANVAGLRVAS